jgi:hypothetical protein
VDPDLTEMFSRDPFSIPQEEKEQILLARLQRLTEHHRDRCAPYGRILSSLSFTSAGDLAGLPALPVSLFKTHYLTSIAEDEKFKTMTSSGTTGQAVSQIVLDRETANLQSRALTTVLSKVLGSQRRPMIIVDMPSIVRDRLTFSARGAGVLGMLPFGRKHFYALDDDMRLDVPGLRSFLADHSGEPLVMFGFTFMIWKYLHQAVVASGEALDLSQATLIHSGGWKKLQEEAVGNAEFRAALRDSTGLNDIHNFYGMVEQTGSVYLEGDDGFLYPSNFSDVIIRDPLTWQEAPNGQVGVVEVLSALPQSYPGHVLLTEDLGVVHGVGQPDSGWCGKQLEIRGRVPRTELRGCSDTHAFNREVA